ncbi:MAG TPA: D-alanyl-D-alanine carboxypeptidase family protein [Actinotalea sp.]
MTEQQRTATHRPHVDGPGVDGSPSDDATAHGTADTAASTSGAGAITPLTRRQIRLAAQRLDVQHPDEQGRTEPDASAVPAAVPAAPVSRRDLRARAADTTPGPPPTVNQPVTPRTPAAPPASTDEPRDDEASPAPLSPVGTLGQDPSPLPSRRALRHGASSCPEPFPLLRTHPASPSGGQQRVGKALTAVALSGALLVSGFALQRADRSLEAGSTDVSARGALLGQVARTNAAAATRLTAQGEAFAGQRRTEALQTAQAALAETETVVRTAAPVLDAATLAPLTAAAARLEELLQAGGGADLSGVAPAAPAATSAQDDDLAARAASAAQASRSLVAARGAVPTESPLAPTPTATPSAPAVASTPADEAETAPDATADVTADVTSAPSPAAGSSDASAAEPAPDQTPAAPTDVAASAELSRAAAEVSALAGQIRAQLDAQVAADEARSLEAAAAAAKAAEIAHKVAVAKAAPNGQIPRDALCSPSFAPQALLRCDAAAALEELDVAYRAEFGHDLAIVSSYRSYAMQVATRRSRGWLAAVPGTSNHGLAVAVDFDAFGHLGSFSSPNYLWMKRHAAEFGWSHPRLMERGGGGPQEPWHWEFGTD